jgi:hypothetical protein
VVPGLLMSTGITEKVLDVPERAEQATSWKGSSLLTLWFEIEITIYLSIYLV